MQAIQDIALLIQVQYRDIKEYYLFIVIVQGHLGFLAHVLESVKNVFNFSVPFLSWLAFVVVFLITIVLYFVPLRFVINTVLHIHDSPVRVLLILWGTNKFLKKLFKPMAVNNNELADFISRVPDNEELVIFSLF
jgi:hypothetical protein